MPPSSACCRNFVMSAPPPFYMEPTPRASEPIIAASITHRARLRRRGAAAEGLRDEARDGLQPEHHCGLMAAPLGVERGGRGGAWRRGTGCGHGRAWLQSPLLPLLLLLRCPGPAEATAVHKHWCVLGAAAAREWRLVYRSGCGRGTDACVTAMRWQSWNDPSESLQTRAVCVCVCPH